MVVNKEEYIKKYGKEAYKGQLQKRRERWKQHPKRKEPKEACASNQEWRKNHPEKIKANNQENNRKGGKYYDHCCEYRSTGIPHERVLVRMKHRNHYRPYKTIIAPDSQIHHQWIPNTANYTGVALVETDQHLHGFIDVIQILEGEITLLTEDEIKGSNNHV